MIHVPVCGFHSTRHCVAALTESCPGFPPAQSEVKQKAEVAAYFKRFEAAERMYLDMDRGSVGGCVQCWATASDRGSVGSCVQCWATASNRGSVGSCVQCWPQHPTGGQWAAVCSAGPQHPTGGQWAAVCSAGPQHPTGGQWVAVCSAGLQHPTGGQWAAVCSAGPQHHRAPLPSSSFVTCHLSLYGARALCTIL